MSNSTLKLPQRATGQYYIMRDGIIVDATIAAQGGWVEVNRAFSEDGRPRKITPDETAAAEEDILAGRYDLYGQ
jgi:hypothetical protein